MPLPISDDLRRKLTLLVRESQEPAREEILALLDAPEGLGMAEVGALEAFIARDEVRSQLDAHHDDLTKLAAFCRNAQLRQQAQRFAATPQMTAPAPGAMVGAMAGYLDAYPHIDYAAHQKDYFLRHYRSFLDGLGHAAHAVDLTSPSLAYFTAMDGAQRAAFVVDIEEIQGDRALIAAAKTIGVAMLELNGGLGSSIGLNPLNHHAKATGIQIPAVLNTPTGPEQVELSIMEAKLRSLATQVGSFRELHVFPLNSTITRDGWSSFITAPSLEARIGRRNPSVTNNAILKESGLIFRSQVIQEGFPKVLQSTLLPVETGNADLDVAPGGHGQILFELYYAEKLHKLMSYGVEVLVIGNADGKQARPHPAIVAKIVRDDIPAALISTDRTAIDAKGGIFAVADGRLGIIERSQVDKPQLPLFEQIGLRPGDAPQPFNTNTVYINIPKLLAFLEQVRAEGGEEAVRQMLMPTTIANKKKVEVGGEDLPVYILEGAIASVVLKLPGVKIFNAPSKSRWTQFTPVKGPADVVYLYRSDVFAVDAMTGELIPQTPDPVPPAITLEGWEGWKQLSATLDAFGHPLMKELKSLSIIGAVFPTDAIMRGRVEIVSASARPVYLTSADYAALLPIVHRRILLENVRLIIDAEGAMTVQPIGTTTPPDGTPPASGGKEPPRRGPTSTASTPGAHASSPQFTGVVDAPSGGSAENAPAAEATVEGAMELVLPGAERAPAAAPFCPAFPFFVPMP